MHQRFGIDSVIFTKIDDLEYSIDFSETGTYEMFYEEESEEDMEEWYFMGSKKVYFPFSLLSILRRAAICVRMPISQQS